MSTFVVATKVDKTAQAVQTSITIDWTGMTEEMYRALATPTLVIKRQGEYRTKGSVPATDTIVAKDNLPGVRSAPLTPQQALAALPLAERIAMLQKSIAEEKAKQK